VLNVDITPATVIFVYLVPEGLKKMRDALINAIQRGVRIVSYGKITVLYLLRYLSNILSVFSIPTLKPGEVVLYKSSTKLYLYDKVEFLD
jgi:predicted AAA+ superfamily ATPase